jgi:hypothetical protein
VIYPCFEDLMTLDAPEKTTNQRPALALSRQPRVIAFIGSSDNTAMDSLLAGLVEALSAPDRRVAVVDGPVDFALMGGTDRADFLLVDLPFRPGPFAGSVLAGCDLVVVAGSCKFEYLPEAENIVKSLLYLGIDSEKVAGVVVDPDGILSSEDLAGLGSYLESFLGIEMAGAVSLEGAQPSRDIERLARYLMPRLGPALAPAFSGAA